MSIELDLQIASESAGLPGANDFRRWVEAALAGRTTKTELTVRIVDEAEGRELNRTWRGKDYATNVLSFPADLPESLDLPLLGDLVLCAPVVAREAVEQEKRADAHWAHLTVHGCLHLLGFDHETDRQADIMEALETEILSRLGYADPYKEI